MTGFAATGLPGTAMLDAVAAALKADVALMAIVTGVWDYVPPAVRQNLPYVKVGTTQDHDATAYGGMQRSGIWMNFAVDSWSDYNGAYEMEQICDRIHAVLERQNLTVAGFELAGGSLHCTISQIFEEVDPNMPERGLYHGHVEWEALLEEAV
jgi:Protein of unknown function (DUF3168)